MQLLVLILKKVELVDELMQQLAESNIKGGTIVEGTGMANALLNMEDLPIFGMLRHLISDEEKEACKILMFVIKEEQLIVARGTIKDVIGDLKSPNTGIVFSVPITFVEGFGD